MKNIRGAKYDSSIYPTTGMFFGPVEVPESLFSGVFASNGDKRQQFSPEKLPWNPC